MLSERFAEAERELFQVQKGETSLSSLFGSEKQLTLKECFDLELIRLEKEFKSGYYDKILALRKQVDESVLVDAIDEAWISNMVFNLSKLGNINNTIKKKIKVIRGIILEYSKKGVTKEIKDYSIPTTKSLKQKLTSTELSSLESPIKEDTKMEKGENFFTEITNKHLKDYRPVLRMQSKNPSVAQSGKFINEIYEGVEKPGITIAINENCKKSIFDYQYALEDSDGTIKKTKKKNKVTGVTYEEFGHCSDVKRYIVTTAFANEYLEFQNKKKTNTSSLSLIR